MINLKGLVRIVRTCGLTGVILEDREQENLIPNEIFQDSPFMQTNFRDIYDDFDKYSGGTIILSDDNREPTKHRHTIDGVFATGFIDNGVTSPTRVSSPDLYIQIQGRIGFTGATRTINTIGLEKPDMGQFNPTVSAQQNNYIPRRNTVDVLAYLKLAVPCIQGETDIIDVFYRVIVDSSNFTGQYNLTERAVREINEGFIGSTGFLQGFASPFPVSNSIMISALVSSICTIPNQTNYPYLEFGTLSTVREVDLQSGILCGNSAAVGNIGVDAKNGNNALTTSQNKSLYKRKYSVNISPKTSIITVEEAARANTNARTGQILTTLLYGLSSPNPSIGASSPNGALIPHTCAAFYTDNVNRPIFQSVYTHSANALYPFQDTNNLGFGSGQYTLTETTEWNNKIPQMLYLEIGATGEVNTATYRFSIRNYMGFWGNSWNFDRPTICPFILTTRPYTIAQREGISLATEVPFENCHGNSSHNARKFSKTQIVQWDVTGLTLLDVFSGEYENWNANTTPALVVTDLYQVEVDKEDGIIYAACRSNGLFRIIPTGFPSPGVTQLSTDPCTGVDVGRLGKVWCTFSGVNGRLSNSDNYATPISFAAADITTGTGASWSNVDFIKADPTHPNDRIAIKTTNSTTARITWYQQSDGAISSITDTTERLLGLRYSQSFDVSDIGSLWAIYQNSFGNIGLVFLAWGSTGSIPTSGNRLLGTPPGYAVQFTEQGFLIGNNWVGNGNVPTNGNTVNNISPITTLAGQTFAYTQSLSNVFGSFTENTASYIIQSNRFVYLEKGIAHFGVYNSPIFPNFIRVTPGGGRNAGTGATIRNPLVWDYYEWNGSAWVEREWTFSAGTWSQASAIGFKTTHSTAQTLINGISIQFANGSVAPSYNVTDYYTQVICKGLHKDMSNTFTSEWDFYSKPLIREQPISTTIPSSFPYLITLPKSPFGSSPDNEFSSLEYEAGSKLNTINIAGYGSPAVVYYADPRTVNIGPNEVALDPKGKLMFAAVDANKAVTGTYSYIQSGEAYSGNITSLFGIQGLAIGYDETSITQSSNLVSLWEDITGNGFDAEQLDTNSQFTYIANGLNGVPVVSANTTPFIRYMRIKSSPNAINGKAIEDLSKGFTFIGVMNHNGVAPTNAEGLFVLSTIRPSNNTGGTATNIMRGLNIGRQFTLPAARVEYGYRNVTDFDRRSTQVLPNSGWYLYCFTIFPNGSCQIRINEQITNFSKSDNGIFSQIMMEPRLDNYINYSPDSAISTSSVARVSIACQYFFNVGLNHQELTHIAAQLKTKYALTGY